MTTKQIRKQYELYITRNDDISVRVVLIESTCR